MEFIGRSYWKSYIDFVVVERLGNKAVNLVEIFQPDAPDDGMSAAVLKVGLTRGDGLGAARDWVEAQTAGHSGLGR